MNKNKILAEEIYAKGVEFSFWMLEKYPLEFFAKFEKFRNFQRNPCVHFWITNGKNIFCSFCGMNRL